MYFINTFIVLLIVKSISSLKFPKPRYIDPSNIDLILNGVNVSAVQQHPYRHSFITKSNQSHEFITNVAYVTTYTSNYTLNRLFTTTIDEMVYPYVNIDDYAYEALEDTSSAIQVSTEVEEATSLMTRVSSFATVLGGVSSAINIYKSLTEVSNAQLLDKLNEIEYLEKLEINMLQNIQENIFNIEKELSQLSTQIAQLIDKIELHDEWDALRQQNTIIMEQWNCILAISNQNYSIQSIERYDCCPQHYTHYENNSYLCQKELAESILSTGINPTDMDSASAGSFRTEYYNLFSTLTGSGEYNHEPDVTSGFLYLTAKNLWNSLLPSSVSKTTTVNASYFFEQFTNVAHYQKVTLIRGAKVLVFAECLATDYSIQNCYAEYLKRSRDLISYESYVTYSIPDNILLTHYPAMMNLTRHCSIQHVEPNNVSYQCTNYTPVVAPQLVYVGYYYNQKHGCVGLQKRDVYNNTFLVNDDGYSRHKVVQVPSTFTITSTQGYEWKVYGNITNSIISSSNSEELDVDNENNWNMIINEFFQGLTTIYSGPLNNPCHLSNDPLISELFIVNNTHDHWQFCQDTQTWTEFTTMDNVTFLYSQLDYDTLVGDANIDGWNIMYWTPPLTTWDGESCPGKYATLYEDLSKDSLFLEQIVSDNSVSPNDPTRNQEWFKFYTNKHNCLSSQ